MKITYNGRMGGESVTVLEAIEIALTPEPYSYNGALERQEARIDKLQTMVIALATILCADERGHTHEVVTSLLENCFEVEP